MGIPAPNTPKKKVPRKTMLKKWGANGKKKIMEHSETPMKGTKVQKGGKPTISVVKSVRVT